MDNTDIRGVGIFSDDIRISYRWEVGANFLLGNVTGAGGGEFEDVDEKTLVGITGIVGQHAVVDVLLGTFALVAGSEETTSGIGIQTGFEAGGLGIVVDIVDDDSPISVDVTGAFGHTVNDVGWAEITFGSDPMAGIIGRFALRSAGVVIVVESIFLVFGDVFDEIIGGLVGDIGVFLVEEVILRNSVLDFVLGIIFVF